MKLVLIKLFLLCVTVTIADEPIDQSEDIEDNGDGLESDPKSDQCPPDEIIDRFLEILTPDDYDEGKANIKNELKSFDEFLSAQNRIQEYGRNVSDRLSEFTKRLNGRMSEATMEVNLSPDCMKSLVRIGTAARNGELWALKCKSFVLSATQNIFRNVLNLTISL